MEHFEKRKSDDRIVVLILAPEIPRSPDSSPKN
jgi:hypothetical protein